MSGKEGERVTLEVKNRRKQASTRKHFAVSAHVWAVPHNLCYYRHIATNQWARVIKHTTINKTIWLFIRQVYTENSDETQAPAEAADTTSPAPAPAPAESASDAAPAPAGRASDAASSTAPAPAPAGSASDAASATAPAHDVDSESESRTGDILYVRICPLCQNFDSLC